MIIRRTALVLAGVAAFALVAFGRGAPDSKPPRASTTPAFIVPKEDPHFAWWRFASTSQNMVEPVPTEDAYTAWWIFATTSQDVIAPD